MKIAYLANVRFPSERAHAAQIAHMCAAFVETGVVVDLYVNRLSYIEEDAQTFFRLPVSLSVIKLWHGFYRSGWQWTFYVSELVFTLNFLLRYYARQYDILYIRSEWIGFFLLWFVSARKIVWESHEAHYSLVVRRVLARGIKTVVISEGIRDAYLEKGIPAQQLLVAHDGIDESFFGEVETKMAARARLGIPLDKKVAMYIGGFDAWKGAETFFSASERAPEILFVAIGGTDSQIQQYQRRFPKVRFLGSRPYAELKDNQQAADVLVVPNSATSALSNLYTSPLKLFAHMASGIPLVVAGIPSLINVTGREGLIVVAPDNPDALAKGIKIAWQGNGVDPEKIKVIAMEYTWKKRGTSILSFIGYTTPYA